MATVTKYFDQKKPTGFLKHETTRVMALNNASFRIARGDFVAYAGPNGAGKSTTFKLLCGMLLPQSGSVRVFGANPIDDRITTMRRCGVLFGNRSELWWDHPVKASFEWKKAVWSIPDDTYASLLEETSELLGLHEFMGTFARELSLGQRMRANLAMMMLHDPELILLDEPTLGLDVLAKRQMIGFLKKLNRERGKTILVTSHDMDDLTEMAERIMMINKGEIAFDGDYAELMKSAGDRRIIRLRADGDAPDIPEATYMGLERGQHAYEYDAARLPIGEMLMRIGSIPGVSDVETGRMPIERVIVDLFRHWQTADGIAL